MEESRGAIVGSGTFGQFHANSLEVPQYRLFATANQLDDIRGRKCAPIFEEFVAGLTDPFDCRYYSGHSRLGGRYSWYGTVSTLAGYWRVRRKG